MAVDSERPHRGSSTSEFFVCFTARPSCSSSSSMKISSKSLLSPGHADKFREPTLSLSSSLSRRLRSNGSMKGGQSSPMFTTGTKKRGALETTEPSSPKVTCIGQVRVKTKKPGNKMRTRSKRRGEVSFRKMEHQQHQQPQECLPHRNQKWVHIPLTICEALRAFGAEFNCFLPCRSSCTSAREREKGEKRTTNTTATTTSSCGAVFARWLMALQEGEEKGREIELVVGEEERREKVQMVNEIQAVMEEEKGEEAKETEEEEARVSICIPPRNALLLMRCRSEPLRMSALANRFWDSPVPKENDDDDDEEEDEGDEEDDNEEPNGGVGGEDESAVKAESKEEEMSERPVSAETIEESECPQGEECAALEEIPEAEGETEAAAAAAEEEEEENPGKQEEREESPEVERTETEEEIMVYGYSFESVEEPENTDQKEKEEDEEQKEEGSEEKRVCSSTSASSPVSVQQEEEESEPTAEASAEEGPSLRDREERPSGEEKEKENEERPTEQEETEKIEGDVTHSQADGKEEKSNEKEPRKDEAATLPDCLLLMMCEPKLSMEVSKETWVCSTDFIRCRPEKKANTNNGGREQKKTVGTDSKPAHPAHHQQPKQLLQPARSSCSHPAPAAAPLMATMLDQKLVNAVGYEPFVLTRCKSEPMRSSAKLAQDACFWKNRKLEPHRPPRLGVGAAGIGF